MTMLEPIWEQKRPSFEDVQQMWRELQISYQPLEHPAVDRLLRHLRATHINGGAEFANFVLSEHPVLHWFGSRNRLGEIDFFNKFLSAPTVISALPTLKIESSSVSINMRGGTVPLTLDGEIATTLVHGGAYHEFRGTPRQAKYIGACFCDAMFGDRFTEVLLFSSWEKWTRWFWGTAWDRTWLGFDKRENRVWLLCVTDTD